MARLYSDIVDAIVTGLVSIGLLVGVFSWGSKVFDDSDSDTYVEIAFILTFTVLVLGVPIAALLYTGGAYLLTGTTAGKRLVGLGIESSTAGRLGRMRLMSRSLIKWGPYTAFGTLALVIVLTIFINSSGNELSGLETAVAISLNIVSYIFAIFMLVYIFLDQMLPWVRADCRSLTDIITRTKVVFKDQPFATETPIEHSEV